MGAKEPPQLEGHTQRDEEVTVDVFEVSGSIKWFDASKGYGFIVPDDDLPDVLLHVTCLRRDGFQTAYEGARVVCEVLRRPKGLQAFRIRAMDNSTAVHPSQLPQRTHVVVIPESDWERATVKWFNRLRGFGFVTRGDQNSGYLRAYGDAPALRLHGAPARSNSARQIWQGAEGTDGGGAQAGRLARTVLPLTIWMVDRLTRGAALSLLALGIVAQASALAAGTGTLVLETESGDHSFNIEVANTNQERALGLMFRRSLPADGGMLFLYDRPQPAAMWMKNTLIPLDMVFISPDGTVHRIEQNAEPHSTALIPSEGPVVGVLELNGGEAAKIRLKRGDKVLYPGLVDR